MSTLISLDDLLAKLGRRSVTLVEALPAAHYARGHLPTAVNLPLDTLERAAAAVLTDKGAEVVVYCSGPTCGNSHVAQRKLEALGYGNVLVFAGGKAEWTERGNALEVAS